MERLAKHARLPDRVRHRPGKLLNALWSPNVVEPIAGRVLENRSGRLPVSGATRAWQARWNILQRCARSTVAQSRPVTRLSFSRR